MTRRLAVCCAPQLLIALDFSVMSVSLPGLAEDLDIAGASVPLVFAAYSLPFGSLLLAAGHLVDRVGPARCLVVGLGIFSGGALATAAAPSAALLLAGRAVEGAGAAAIAPSSLALTAASFGAGDARRRAFARYAASISIGFVAGSLIAGSAGELASWRAPVALVGAVGVVALVTALAPGSVVAPTRGSPGAGRVPVPATAAMLCASVLLVAVTAGHADPLLLVFVAVAGAPGLVSGARFWDAPFLVAVAGSSFVTATGVTGTLLLTLDLQGPRGLGPLAAAAMLVVFGLPVLAARSVSAAVAARFGEPSVLGIGLAVQGAALSALAVSIAAASATPPLLALIAAFGLGHVVANTGVALAAAAAPARKHGRAGSIVGAAQYLGAAVGPLVLVGGATTPARMGAAIAIAGVAACAAGVLVLLLRFRARPAGRGSAL